MSPAQSHSGPSTEIRLSARAHPTTTLDRAHAPPDADAGTQSPHNSDHQELTHTSCTDKERGCAQLKSVRREVRFMVHSSEGTAQMVTIGIDPHTHSLRGLR